MSALSWRSRPAGAHRRTPNAWQDMAASLGIAEATVRQLTSKLADALRALAAERELRAHADALMGRLVAERDAANSRATVAEARAEQASDLVAALRLDLAGPTPHTSTLDTQQLPVVTPDVVPLCDGWAAGMGCGIVTVTVRSWRNVVLAGPTPAAGLTDSDRLRAALTIGAHAQARSTHTVAEDCSELLEALGLTPVGPLQRPNLVCEETGEPATATCYAYGCRSASCRAVNTWHKAIARNGRAS